ncbi:MAG: hypothetical protein IIA88_09855 [Bacteroidetes bacterium]|nr:hypothetical protein [Bacteroidota bacterium]
MEKQSSLIEKEKIGKLQFPGEEVLKSLTAIEKRRLQLEGATILGNSYRHKVKIIFETLKGIKQVDTTIWATTEKNITLKGGVIIPIHCIHKVEAH